MRDYTSDIEQAKATGGYLIIGRGGDALHYVNQWGGDSYLQTYASDELKAQAIAAGLPVIDSRCCKFDDVYKVAVRGPMIGIASYQKHGTPPYHSLDNAPLAYVAETYRQIGAEVHNI